MTYDDEEPGDPSADFFFLVLVGVVVGTGVATKDRGELVFAARLLTMPLLPISQHIPPSIKRPQPMPIKVRTAASNPPAARDPDPPPIDC